MKKIRVSLVCALACLFVWGCDSNTNMCTTNDECAAFCRTYDGNSVISACMKGECKCVANEYLVCTGNPEKDHCEDICAKYRPGTRAECVSNFCECQEKECEVSTDCSAKCPGAAMMACETGKCQCLSPSELACSGDDANAHCKEICDRYAPDSMASCQDGSCACKTSACTSENDCQALCESMGAALTACTSGKCQCIGKDALACSGEDAASRCNKICSTYKPGSLAVCESGYCTCQAL